MEGGPLRRAWRSAGQVTAVAASLFFGRRGPEAFVPRAVILQSSLLLAVRAVLPALLPFSARDDASRAVQLWHSTTLTSLQVTLGLCAAASLLPTVHPIIGRIRNVLDPKGPISGLSLAYETVVLTAGPLLACAEAASLTIDAVFIGRRLVERMRRRSEHDDHPAWKFVILLFSVALFAVAIVATLFVRDTYSGPMSTRVSAGLASLFALVTLGALFSVPANISDAAFVSAYVGLSAVAARVERATLDVSGVDSGSLLVKELPRANGMLLLLTVPSVVYAVKRMPTILRAVFEVQTSPDRGEDDVERGFSSFLTVVGLTFRVLCYHGLEAGEYLPELWRGLQAVVIVVTFILCTLDEDDLSRSN